MADVDSTSGQKITSDKRELTAIEDKGVRTPNELTNCEGTETRAMFQSTRARYVLA